MGVQWEIRSSFPGKAQEMTGYSKAHEDFGGRRSISFDAFAAE
ncbi:hypothetical protein [Paenibacillus sp. CECT 9249]|nr:hypothetical protein [Paenibacillus sp. CECT 9249]